MGVKVTWFEIPVLNMDRAKAFYEEVFKIEIEVQDLGEVLMGFLPPADGSGVPIGALVQYEEYVPNDKSVLLYFDSSDISTELQRVPSAGGTIQRERTMISEENGYMGVFIDSEGNRIALHSNQ